MLKRRFYLWLGVMVLAHLVLSYFGLLQYQYPIAPGDDIYNHLKYAESLALHPTLVTPYGYPPGFHYLLIGLTSVTNLSLVTAITWLWPLLPVLSGIALCALAYRSFGARAALVCYFLFAFVSLQPHQTASDGSLANLLASNILLPLLLLSWINLWGSNRKPLHLAGVALLTLAIVLTHHFSTVVTLSTLLLSATLLISIYQSRAHGLARGVLTGFLALSGISLLMYVLYQYVPIFEALRGLVAASQEISKEGKQYPVLRLIWTISPLIVGLGAIGWLLAAREYFKQRTVPTVVFVTLSIWLLFYFLGSRFSQAGEPERLGRDFAMPATLFASYFVSWAWERMISWSAAAKLITVLVILLVLVPSMSIKISRFVRYEPMIRFSAADKSLLQELSMEGGTSVLWVRNPMWELMARDEIEQGKIRLVYATGDALYELRTSGCVYVSLYKPGTWPQSWQDATPLSLIAEQGARRVSTVEDAIKVWYRFCK